MIRTHKRNKAFECLDSSLNYSVNLNRFSFGVDYSGPLTLRLSTGVNEEQHLFLAAQKQIELRESISSQKSNKARNLRENLRQLQEKVRLASGHLRCNKRQHPVFLRQTMKAEMSPPKLFTCHQIPQSESTLNIQSQIKFQNMINSKRAKDYYVGTIIRGISSSNRAVRSYLTQAISQMRFALSKEYPSIFELQHRKVNIDIKSKYHGCKTLVVELDNTILVWNSQRTKEEDLEVGSGSQKGFITLRPYALSFLRRIAANFEIIVFSRLESQQLRLIIQELDPEGKLISGYLGRQACCLLPGDLISKDLRILNRNLRDTLILQSDISSVVQVNNIIPMVPPTEGDERQLMELQRFLLREVPKCSDVRELCRRWFKLQKYWQFQSQQELVQELYL